METSMKTWIDPPEGWRYGFPKVYDPSSGISVKEWLKKEGYPLEASYLRQWRIVDES